MRPRAPLAAFLAAAALAAAGCAASPGPAEESTAAGTGFRAPDSPIVNLRIVFRTGSIDDPPGLHGLNALTALMIGAGGTETLAYDELAETLYPWSASISAQSDKEVTTVTGRVHRDHLEPFYAIFRDLILAPRFDPADFERNRDRLRNAVVSTLRGNDDEELGKEALNALLYRGHPYEAPTLGTELGLEAITLDDVREFHAQRYTRGNFLAGAGGGYPEGFLARVDTDLRDNLPEGGGEPAELPAPRVLEGVELLVVEKQAIATAISIGFPIGLTRADDDFYPLLVANSYFGEHRTFNGLLMNVMRGQRGLNYGDYSYIENFIQAGGSRMPVPNIPRRQQFFSIWIRPVPHHNAHFALRQAMRELQRLVEQGLSQEDFEATRDFLLNYSQLYVQTTDRRLGYLMDARFYDSGFLVDEIRARLPELTVDDVNAAIRRHLRFDDLGVAVVTSNAEEFVERLLAGEPSPPTYNTAVGEDILAEDAEIIEYPIPFNMERVQIVPVREMFRDVSAG
ncbi:MAG: insulinase family protein [Acidobacteria bacterium]|nr:insulinase family protein [Acidobacteriota bacterium]